jgi:urease accessory protein
MSMIEPLIPSPTERVCAQDADLCRARGRAGLSFAADAGGSTRLARLAQRSPLRVLRPLDAGAEQAAVLLNTAGGVCGGDRLDVEVDVGAGALATVSTQAAEKVYRALDSRARLRTTLRIEAAGRLHWAPQETILFDAARFERRTEIHLAAGARLLAAEMLVFGRRAMGEELTRLDVRDDWRLFVEGRLRWADAFALCGNPPEALRAPTGLDAHEALATTLWCAPGPEQLCAGARERLGLHRVESGVSVLRHVSVARLLGSARAVRCALVDLLTHLREAVLGFGAALPRVWAT